VPLLVTVLVTITAVIAVSAVIDPLLTIDDPERGPRCRRTKIPVLPAPPVAMMGRCSSPHGCCGDHRDRGGAPGDHAGIVDGIAAAEDVDTDGTAGDRPGVLHDVEVSVDLDAVDRAVRVRCW